MILNKSGLAESHSITRKYNLQTRKASSPSILNQNQTNCGSDDCWLLTLVPLEVSLYAKICRWNLSWYEGSCWRKSLPVLLLQVEEMGNSLELLGVKLIICFFPPGIIAFKASGNLYESVCSNGLRLSQICLHQWLTAESTVLQQLDLIVPS